MCLILSWLKPKGSLLKCHVHSLSWPPGLIFHHFCFSQIPSIAISLVYNNITPFLFSVLPKNKKRSCSSFLAPLQPCDYHATVAKIYVGAQFISVCLLVVIKGLSAKQKSFPQQRFFFFLMLTARLTVDFILQAQLGVSLIVWNCRSIVDLIV